VNERRVEHHRIRDAFRLVREMLSDERVVKSQLAAKNNRFAVLAQHLGVVAVSGCTGMAK
jgi:hypothetical protein